MPSAGEDTEEEAASSPLERLMALYYVAPAAAGDPSILEEPDSEDTDEE